MKKKVLLMEDHKIHREVIYDGLEDMGFEVINVRDAQEARNFLKNEGFKPDLFIFDIVIGSIKTQGILLKEELSKNPAYKDIPVLFITAHIEEKDIAEYFPDGSRENVLTKPFDLEQLLSKIRQVMSK